MQEKGGPSVSSFLGQTNQLFSVHLFLHLHHSFKKPKISHKTIKGIAKWDTEMWARYFNWDTAEVEGLLQTSDMQYLHNPHVAILTRPLLYKHPDA